MKTNCVRRIATISVVLLAPALHLSDLFAQGAPAPTPTYQYYRMPPPPPAYQIDTMQQYQVQPSPPPAPPVYEIKTIEQYQAQPPAFKGVEQFAPLTVEVPPPPPPPSTPPPSPPPPALRISDKLVEAAPADPCLQKGTADSLDYQCCKTASQTLSTAARLRSVDMMNQDIFDCCMAKKIPVHLDGKVTPEEDQQCSCYINPRSSGCFSCLGRQSIDQYISCFGKTPRASSMSASVDYDTKPGKAIITFGSSDSKRTTTLNLCACDSPQPLTPPPACASDMNDPLSLACYSAEQIDDLKNMGYAAQLSDDGKSVVITDAAKSVDDCTARGGQPVTPPPPPPAPPPPAPPPPSPAPTTVEAARFEEMKAYDIESASTGATGATGATSSTGATGSTGVSAVLTGVNEMYIRRIQCAFTRPLCPCEAPKEPPPPPPPPAPTPPPAPPPPPANTDLRAAMCRWGDTEARMLDTGETIALKEPCQALDLSILTSKKAADLYNLAGKYYHDPKPDNLTNIRTALANELSSNTDDTKPGYGVAMMTLPPPENAGDGASVTDLNPDDVRKHYAAIKDIALSASDGKIKVSSPDALSLFGVSGAVGGAPQPASATLMMKTLADTTSGQTSVTLITLDMAQAEGGTGGCSLLLK